MSAPALPEIFGNYTLGDFVEVVSPDAVSWWPQTAGWAWLGLALLAIAARWSWKWLLHWYHNRYRREAAQKLQELGSAAVSVSDINRLLKLVALAAFSREQVASLSGESWVAFLNGQCEEPVFDANQGQLLALGGYTNKAIEDVAAEQLLGASLTWIQRHKNPHDA